MEEIKITIKAVKAHGCHECVFDRSRCGYDGYAPSCVGSWLMKELAGVDCTEGYQFVSIKSKEKQ